MRNPSRSVVSRKLSFASSALIMSLPLNQQGIVKQSTHLLCGWRPSGLRQLLGLVDGFEASLANTSRSVNEPAQWLTKHEDRDKPQDEADNRPCDPGHVAIACSIGRRLRRLTARRLQRLVGSLTCHSKARTRTDLTVAWSPG